MDIDLSTPKDWPDHAKEFMALDQLLRCSICFQFFTNCMMTQCAHNFCSLCIRRYLSLKSNCPICYQEAFEPALRKNRIVDEILQTFCAARSNLIKIIGKPTISHTKDDFSSLAAAADCQESNESFVEKRDFPIESEKVNELKDPAKITFSSEACLTQPAYLRKPIYRLMKDKDIKECLKKAGLSTKGKRKELIERHKQYVCLYNAECDAENPKPVKEIIKEVEEEEKQKKTPQKLFNTNRNSEPEDIEKERHKYVIDNKQHFDFLVTEASKTRKRKGNSHSDMNGQNEPSSSNISVDSITIEISSESEGDHKDYESDSTVEFNKPSPSKTALFQQSPDRSNENEMFCSKDSDSSTSSCSTVELNMPVLESCSNFSSQDESIHVQGLFNNFDKSKTTTITIKRLNLRKRGLCDKDCQESTAAKSFCK